MNSGCAMIATNPDRRLTGYAGPQAMPKLRDTAKDVVPRGQLSSGVPIRRTAPAIRVQVFGGPKLVGPDGQPITISGRKSLALIVFLSASPDMTASKDRLADLFWSDRGDEQARNSLRQTLTVLRRELCAIAPELLIAERHTVLLRRDLIDCQAEQFLRLIASGSETDLRQAADLYAGPFLDGFFSGSSVFEDWAQTAREEYQERCVASLDTLVRLAGGEAAAGYARRLIAIDPTRENSHRLMMQVLAATGHRDRALRQYAACRDMLRREFGVEPGAETEAALRAIQAEARGIAPEAANMRAAPARAISGDASPTVQVLDFANLTGLAEQDHFVSGLAADITTELSHQREIVVLTARPPGAALPDKAHPAAGFILSGSVQGTATHLRVNAQLIDVAQGVHVWAERFDGPGADLLEFQESVAHSVALAVRIDLLLGNWKVRDRTPADAPNVRLLVQRAFVKYYEMTNASLAEALTLGEEALRTDPGSVRARRNLSLILSACMSQGVLPKTRDHVDRAMALAREAIAAVPEDELGRCAMSWALSTAARHAEAVDELRHAVSLNPRFPTPYSDLAEQYAYLGMADQAIAAAQTAFRLASHDPISFWRHYSVVVAQFSTGDFHAAREGAHRIVRTRPGFLRALLFWAASAAAVGNSQEAREAIDTVLSIRPDLSLGTVAPGFMPRYVQDRHHALFLDMLRRAGLPE